MLTRFSVIKSQCSLGLTARCLLGQNEHYTEGKILRWKKMSVPLEIFHGQIILLNVSLDVKIEPSTKIQPNSKHSYPESHNNPNGDDISSTVLPAPSL